MYQGIRRLCSRCLFAGALWCLAAAVCAADLDPYDLIEVSYIHAAILGTGTYTLNDRRITMLKMPFAWNQRPASAESVGWRWLAPTVLGYDDLSGVGSDIIESLLPDQLVTLSVMPGVEFIYPVNERWYLKPFVEIGGGRDFNQEETFFLTHLGLRTLAPFEFGENWQLLLGGALRWAGEYQVRSEDTNAFGIIDLGLDVRRNLPWKLFQQRLNMGAYYLYQHYLPEWRAGEADDWRNRAREVHEFGLSLGIPQGKKFFGFNVRRVRVGFKKGGKFQGWTFGTEFPF
jgi:hypothetical protein